MLILVKTAQEILIGQNEVTLSSGLGIELNRLARPMRLETFIMQQQSRIAGQKTQQVSAFRTVPLPCSEIFLDRVDYWGEVKEHEDVYEAYFKVLQAIEKNEKQKETPAILAS